MTNSSKGGFKPPFVLPKMDCEVVLGYDII